MKRQTDRLSTPAGRSPGRPLGGRPKRRWLGLSAVAAALALVPIVAAGAEPVARDQIDRLVRDAVGDSHRVEVEIGSLDSRLRLAPCDRIEPFVPAGARLWGRTVIGVRCVDGARWNVSLPINVRVYGQALVANRTVLAGTPAPEADFRLAEVELTRQPRGVIDDPALLDGKMVGRAIAAGQPLRAEDLRVLQTVAPGDPVHIRLVGNGFEIGAEGVALSGAGDGQAVRVRTDTGKVLSGTARGRTVEIRM